MVGYFYLPDLFVEHAPIPRTGQRAVSHSAPQANEPPDIVLGAMKWLPKASVRTAVGLGAIAAIIMATSKRGARGGSLRHIMAGGATAR